MLRSPNTEVKVRDGYVKVGAHALKAGATLPPKEPMNDLLAAKKTRMILSKRNGKKRGGFKGKNGRATPRLPPELECSPVIGAWFRFDATSTLSGSTITKNHLMAVPGCIGTVANTTGATIASAVRLRKIRIWPAAGGEANITWNGSPGKMRDESKDVTLPTGITVDRACELTPPPGSYASMWWEAAETSVSIFMMNVTAGAVIDVLLDYTLANAMAGTNVTFATILVGGMVYGYLDGNGSHLVKPLGRITSF